MNTVSIPLTLWTHPLCADYRRGWKLSRLCNLFRVFQLAGETRALRMRLSNWRANLDYPLKNIVAFMERLQSDGLATWTVENAEQGDDAFGTLTWADVLRTVEDAPVEAEPVYQPRPKYPSDLRPRAVKNGHIAAPHGLRTDSAHGSAPTPQNGFAESYTRARGERDSSRERDSPLGGLSLSLESEEGSGEKGGASADSAHGSAPTPQKAKGNRAASSLEADSSESAWSELAAIYDPASVQRVRQFIAAKNRAAEEKKSEKIGSEISYARQILERDLKAQGNGRASGQGALGGASLADIEVEIGAELEALNIYERFSIERDGNGGGEP